MPEPKSENCAEKLLSRFSKGLVISILAGMGVFIDPAFYAEAQPSYVGYDLMLGDRKFASRIQQYSPRRLGARGNGLQLESTERNYWLE